MHQKGFENKVLEAESVAELDYRPNKCKKTYRMVVVRKNISVQKGEVVLFDEIRYFFYITNRRDLTKEQVVAFANQRCDQENVIEQLKNGVNAMRMPVDDLLSNWAYMVMTALAWNLKAWYGLLMPNRQRGTGDREDGVSALPSRHHLAPRANHPKRAPNCLSAFKLERVDGRFYQHLGAIPIYVAWVADQVTANAQPQRKDCRRIQKRGQN